MFDETDSALFDAAEDDLISLPRRRTEEESSMDITPMIDITFLLLIFFLVAARLQQSITAELPQARYGEGVATKTAAVLTVIPGPGEHAHVFKGDTIADQARVKAADLMEQEREIAAYVEQEYVGDPPRVVPKRHVLIRAAREVRSREVARVARAAGKAQTAWPIQMYFAVRETGQ
jgi:biopolymer transport protein ExbD